MDTKRDIETRQDIEKMLVKFYSTVKLDPVIGIIFNEIVPIVWEHHIPVITDFWETVLLDNPVYSKNAMAVHYSINNIYPLHKKHFDAWLTIFNDTINGMYTGPVANLAKKRAAAIASLMQHKMENNNF